MDELFKKLPSLSLTKSSTRKPHQSSSSSSRSSSRPPSPGPPEAVPPLYPLPPYPETLLSPPPPPPPPPPPVAGAIQPPMPTSSPPPPALTQTSVDRRDQAARVFEPSPLRRMELHEREKQRQKEQQETLRKQQQRARYRNRRSLSSEDVCLAGPALVSSQSRARSVSPAASTLRKSEPSRSRRLGKKLNISNWKSSSSPNLSDVSSNNSSRTRLTTIDTTTRRESGLAPARSFEEMGIDGTGSEMISNTNSPATHNSSNDLAFTVWRESAQDFRTTSGIHQSDDVYHGEEGTSIMSDQLSLSTDSEALRSIEDLHRSSTDCDTPSLRASESTGLLSLDVSPVLHHDLSSARRRLFHTGEQNHDSDDPFDDSKAIRINLPADDTLRPSSIASGVNNYTAASSSALTIRTTEDPFGFRSSTPSSDAIRRAEEGGKRKTKGKKLIGSVRTRAKTMRRWANHWLTVTAGGGTWKSGEGVSVRSGPKYENEEIGTREAIGLVRSWRRKDLMFFYALLVILTNYLHFESAFSSMIIQKALEEWGYGDFLVNTMIAATSIVSFMIFAKLTNSHSRPWALFIASAFILGGLCLAAGSPEAEFFGMGDALFTIGKMGTFVVAEIIVADISDVVWRGLCIWGLHLGTGIWGWLVLFWAAKDQSKQFAWRNCFWIYFGFALPLIICVLITLFVFQRRAAARGFFPTDYRHSYSWWTFSGFFTNMGKLFTEYDLLAISLWTLGIGLTVVSTRFLRPWGNGNEAEWLGPFLGGILAIILLALWETWLNYGFGITPEDTSNTRTSNNAHPTPPSGGQQIAEIHVFQGDIHGDSNLPSLNACAGRTADRILEAREFARSKNKWFRKKCQPLLRGRVLKNRTVLLGCLAGFLAMFVVEIGTWLSQVHVTHSFEKIEKEGIWWFRDITASTATLTGLLASLFLVFTKQYKWLVFSGFALILTALVVLSLSSVNSIYITASSQMILGAGSGLAIIPLMVGMQASCQTHSDIIIVTALSMTFNALGREIARDILRVVWNKKHYVFDPENSQRWGGLFFAPTWGSIMLVGMVAAMLGVLLIGWGLENNHLDEIEPHYLGTVFGRSDELVNVSGSDLEGSLELPTIGTISERSSMPTVATASYEGQFDITEWGDFSERLSSAGSGHTASRQQSPQFFCNQVRIRDESSQGSINTGESSEIAAESSPENVMSGGSSGIFPIDLDGHAEFVTSRIGPTNSGSFSRLINKSPVPDEVGILRSIDVPEYYTTEEHNTTLPRTQQHEATRNPFSTASKRERRDLLVFLRDSRSREGSKTPPDSDPRQIQSEDSSTDNESMILQVSDRDFSLDGLGEDFREELPHSITRSDQMDLSEIVDCINKLENKNEYTPQGFLTPIREVNSFDSSVRTQSPSRPRSSTSEEEGNSTISATAAVELELPLFYRGNESDSDDN